jgi:hypothetical protein
VEAALEPHTTNHMATFSSTHNSCTRKPRPAQSDPQAALVKLQAGVAAATRRRSQAVKELDKVTSQYDFMSAPIERQARIVMPLEDRRRDADRAFVRAQSKYVTAFNSTAQWMMQTQLPEPPPPMPRTTNRVSYARGSIYTASSSPAVPDPRALQLHTHVYTEPSSGNALTLTAKHRGVEELSVPFSFANADGSMHLHVHTFNDSLLKQAPVRNKPMHLFVDPEAKPREGLKSMILTPLAPVIAAVPPQQLLDEGVVMNKVRGEIHRQNRTRAERSNIQ